ncbi:MAG: TonB C-terminal domain-containing protein [Terracidiphilus sp.]
MSNILEGSEQLERELTPEPMAGPAAGALLLHGLLLAALVSYGLVSGLFRHNLWGNQGASGAMQVNLVSSAIPLPNTQPMNKNVLATETPSPAPALPSPKEQHQIDEKAVPILGKQAKPKEKTTPKTPPHQPQPKQQNLAAYGEQNGTSIPRATQPQNFTSGQTSVTDASFGSLFPWYVGQIDRKMDSSGYRSMADPRTPKGARTYIEWKIFRDGSHGDVRLDSSSGSPTWDNVCLRAAQRVDTFGPLPAQYQGSALQVFYYCEY